MRKKIAKIAVLILGLGMMSSSASAARPEYHFYLENNGRTFSNNTYGTTNKKTFAGQEWSMYVKSIYFSKGIRGAGIAFRLVNTGTGTPSVPKWKSVTGRVDGGAWTDGGPTGTYKLQGRMDDDLSGYCESTGYWNADYIETWPSA